MIYRDVPVFYHWAHTSSSAFDKLMRKEISPLYLELIRTDNKITMRVSGKTVDIPEEIYIDNDAEKLVRFIRVVARLL